MAARTQQANPEIRGARGPVPPRRCPAWPAARRPAQLQEAAAAALVACGLGEQAARAAVDGAATEEAAAWAIEDAVAGRAAPVLRVRVRGRGGVAHSPAWAWTSRLLVIREDRQTGTVS